MFEENLVPDKCLESRFSVKSGLCEGWLETSYLNFCSNSQVLRAVWILSCRRMAPSLNLPGSLRWMASRWPSDYFPFPKLKEHLYGKRFSSGSDGKTSAENWVKGLGRDLYQAGLSKLVLRSDKCLNSLVIMWKSDR
ncbi:hypothetical protein AVEN_72000-1 [Araneus ventricosus]|uniref:Uncharacterized protein n=1 Tax=Araneus ventricosus TaxID=182803 RepID=A0A4Y2DD40_ARAVE|nr:hypothetical protein AVEN_72000-1 [Araneus ventricosus]